MTADSDKIVTLIETTTEQEAQLIVNLLERNEIKARAVGGLTSGFRAEAPGRVQVLVFQNDLAGARNILDQQANDPGEPDPEQ